jgi:hypothetical protein
VALVVEDQVVEALRGVGKMFFGVILFLLYANFLHTCFSDYLSVS